MEKHDERAAEERRFLREKAEKEFRRTHKYNLITGTYYDESKEHDFVQSRAKLESLQGRAQQLRLPPSIRYGEGSDYDIISKQVSNDRHVRDGSSSSSRGGSGGIRALKHEHRHAYDAPKMHCRSLTN